jgi:hypothetical protein
MDTVESTRFGPGLVAFLVVVAMGIALVLLLISMNKHLRRVPKDLDTSANDPSPRPAASQPAAASEGSPTASDAAEPDPPADPSEDPAVG